MDQESQTHLAELLKPGVRSRLPGPIYVSGLESSLRGFVLMDEWQAKALKEFPELHTQITRSQGGLHGLWADLFSAMVAAYRATPPHEDFIRRVYEYAAWCVRQPQTSGDELDLSSATAVGFLENLPLDQQVSDDLHRWLSVKTFEGCETLFRYHLSEAEYSKLHTDFMRKKKDVTRPSVL